MAVTKRRYQRRFRAACISTTARILATRVASYPDREPRERPPLRGLRQLVGDASGEPRRSSAAMLRAWFHPTKNPPTKWGRWPARDA